MQRQTAFSVIGAAGGGILVFVALWLIVFKFLQPLSPQILQERKVEDIPVVQEDKKDVLPDPLEEGFKVELVSVEMPQPLVKIKPQRTKRVVQPKPSSDSHSETNVAVSVTPTTRILAKGRSLLETPDNARKLPQIYGDFSKLGFSKYMQAVYESGGRLMVWDWSAQYGRFPLFELDRNLRARIAAYDHLYVERPRFLRPPYSQRITSVLKSRGIGYPKADLRLAFVLPKKTEYFILGALDETFQSSLYEYETLFGEYQQDKKGCLVFTIRKARKRGEATAKDLAKPAIIRFGLVT